MSEFLRTAPVIAVSMLCVAAGQVFLKRAVTEVVGSEHMIALTKLLAQLFGLLRNLSFWLGLFACGVGFLTWLFVLSRLDMSKAALGVIVLYPLLILAFGVLFLGESKSWINLVGFVVAIVGLCLATMDIG